MKKREKWKERRGKKIGKKEENHRERERRGKRYKKNKRKLYLRI